MSRRVYVAFIATLICHLSLAIWHYQGLYHLPSVCFLTVNFIVMIAIRDWIIGFRLFSVDQELKKTTHARKQIFLFGSFRSEKDPFHKIHKLVNQLGSWKVRALKYLAFSGWTLFCTAIIFPRLNLPLSAGLILGFLASWVFLNSYQFSHFLLAQAISFLIVVLAFLQSNDSSPWIYIPYAVVFFASLSLFRFLCHGLGQDSEKRHQPLFSSHLHNALNITCLFVTCSFLVFHMVEYFASQTQPPIRSVTDRLQKRIEEYANRKIEEYISRQIEKESQQKVPAGLENTQSPSRAQAKNEKKGRLAKPSPGLPKGVEDLVRELAGAQNLKKVQKIEDKLKKDKELFNKLNSDFKKKQSKFVDLERKQVQQAMERSKRQIRELKLEKGQNVDLKALQRDLKNKNLQLSIAELQKILQSSSTKDREVAFQESSFSESQTSGSSDGPGPTDTAGVEPSDAPSNQINEESLPSLAKRRAENQVSLEGDGARSKPSHKNRASTSDQELGFVQGSGSDLGQDFVPVGEGAAKAKPTMGVNDGERSTSGGESRRSKGIDAAASSELASKISSGTSRGKMKAEHTGRPNPNRQDMISERIQKIRADDRTNHSSERIESESKDKALLKKRRIREWKMKIDQIFKHLVGLLKIVLVFISGFFIYRLSRHFRKYKVNETIVKQVGLSDEKTQNIHRKVNVLRQSRLSPDQEVRLTYRFFLETMAMADFPKSPWCPATDFQWQVQQEFIGFEEAVKPITECFCKAEYGQKDLSEEELKQLRTARDLFVSRIVA